MKNKHRRTFRAKIQADTHVVTEVQQMAMDFDSDFLEKYEKVLEYIRPIFHGEFPAEFMKSYEGQKIQWTFVRKEVKLTQDLIIRCPLVDEHFQTLTKDRINTLDDMEQKSGTMPVFIVRMAQEE